MNLGFVTAFGWTCLGLIAYTILMLIGMAWRWAMREGNEQGLIPLIMFHAMAFCLTVLLLAMPPA